MTFVDTGIWYASAHSADADHASSVKLLRHYGAELITTDYVIDETLTLLRIRGRLTAALALGHRFFNSGLTSIHYVTEADIKDAWRIFQQYDDKKWSFTDCVTYVVIQRLQITTALSFDHHFHQFGIIAVVP